ncbi:O-antigen ligase family protein [Polynucleobacter sp. MWH-UH24A]|uniref:O-antigen ligase family protein n=1 Tax=Polynucleobacter sp. MWH-UH24A TaxID=2689110 RepID=UPI001BFE7C30|nr:O-antigen ligase family protein [Polynucleobacter sp. MWH-UH24A]QWD76426.1 O-antigen ligase family protein [Polynucleobacter sp. MWH-UH24A]
MRINIQNNINKINLYSIFSLLLIIYIYFNYEIRSTILSIILLTIPLVFVNPVIGLSIGFIFYGLSGISNLYENSFSFSKLEILITLLILLIKWNKTYTRKLNTALSIKYWKFYSLPFFVITILTIISFNFLNYDLSIFLSRFLSISLLIGLSIFVIILITNIDEYKIFYFYLLIGTILISLYLFFGGYFGRQTILFGNNYIFGYYNHDIAILIALLILFSIPIYEISSSREKYVLLICNLFLLLCLLLSFSRTAIFSLFISLSYIFLCKERIFRLRRIILLTLALSFTFIIIIYSSSSEFIDLIKNRYLYDTESDRDYSGGRLSEVWPKAFEFIKDNIVFGGGLGSDAIYGTAHNVILEITLEGGIIAALIFLFSITMMYQESKKTTHKIFNLSLLIFMLSAALFNPRTLYSIPFAIVIGISAAFFSKKFST